jgi:hypothetical protein
VLHHETNVASAASKAPLGNLGCEWPADCRAQIEAAAPVDTRVYREVSAAFDTRVKAQGATFVKRVAMLRATRAAHHRLQRSKHGSATPPDAIMKEKGRESVAVLEARMVARGKEKLNGKCIGLLDGESEAAAQLCNQVNADTQYMPRRNAARPAPEDTMHTVFY